jgi:hypothetical protein
VGTEIGKLELTAKCHLLLSHTLCTMQKSEYSLVKEEAFWHSFVFIPSLQLMNKCLSPFSVAVTKYLRLVD